MRRALSLGQEDEPQTRFFGMSADATKNIFGKDAYMRRYGDCGEGSPDLHAQPAGIFEDWVLTVDFDGEAVEIICCLEDHLCPGGCARDKRCCERCELPVCKECEAAMSHRGIATMLLAAL